MKKETRFFMKKGTRARAGEEERAEAGARAAADGVEAEDALEAGAVVGELADVAVLRAHVTASTSDEMATNGGRTPADGKPGQRRARHTVVGARDGHERARRQAVAVAWICVWRRGRGAHSSHSHAAATRAVRPAKAGAQGDSGVACQTLPRLQLIQSWRQPRIVLYTTKKM